VKYRGNYAIAGCSFTPVPGIPVLFRNRRLSSSRIFASPPHVSGLGLPRATPQGFSVPLFFLNLNPKEHIMAKKAKKKAAKKKK